MKRSEAFQRRSSTARRGFTMLELLTVVTIIVALVSVLIPAIGKGASHAHRAACMANLRGINVALSGYAADSFGVYPTTQYTSIASCWADAYDLRDCYPYNGPSVRPALGLGLLVTTDQLRVRGLGKVITCPSFDSLDNPAFPGSCMDLHQAGDTYGGSFWDSMPDYRIIGSYNYRGMSYYRQHNSTLLTTRQAVSGFVMAVDTPDVRFRGWQSQYNAHGGYNRMFGDGSGAFMLDPNYEVDAIISYYGSLGQRTTVDGRGGGGGLGNGALDEDIYALMSSHR